MKILKIYHIFKYHKSFKINTVFKFLEFFALDILKSQSIQILQIILISNFIINYI